MVANSICYIFDENFFGQGMTAIKSLIYNNPIVRMDIYAILIGMSDALKGRVRELQTENAKIIVIDASDRISEFKGIDSQGWSYAAYVRLLLEEILPHSVENVLYIDSDTIVVDTIEDIFKIDMTGILGAAVLDKYIGCAEKRAVGMEDGQPYFNSGVLYMNLNQWRKEGIGRKCIEYLKKNKYANNMPDQNALNAIMKGRVVLLPLSYNMDGYSLMMPYKYVRSFFHQGIEEYYAGNSAELYEMARSRPRIVHFIGWYLDKPWVRENLQPYAGEYVKYTELAKVDIPWVEQKLYSGVIAGGIRNKARVHIKRCINREDWKGVRNCYIRTERLLKIGSVLKSFFK